MNKREKFAWARMGVTAAIVAYLIWHLFGGDAALAQRHADVRGFVSNSVYALLFLFVYLSYRVKGVDVDERDHAISGVAARHALVALSLLIFVSANIARGHEYADWISTRPAFWIEQYLILCIGFGWWVESSVSVFLYWRDRRAMRSEAA